MLLSADQLQEIREIIGSKDMAGKFRSLIGQALQGKTPEEVLSLLQGMKAVGPGLGRALGQAADALLGLPLHKLVALIGSAPDKVAKPGRAAAKAPVVKATRVRKPLSPARKKALAIQGRYMGLLRKFTGTERAKIKMIAGTQGTPAAIKFMVQAGKVAKKSSVAKKPVAKKPPARKPAAKKPVAKKPAAPKPVPTPAAS